MEDWLTTSTTGVFKVSKLKTLALFSFDIQMLPDMIHPNPDMLSLF